MSPIERGHDNDRVIMEHLKLKRQANVEQGDSKDTVCSMEEHRPEQWKFPRRLLRRIRRLVRRHKGTVTWLICLLLAGVLGRRFHKRISNTISNAVSLLLISRAQAECRNADDSALSHLLEAIHNQIVTKVLLNASSSVVYYKAHNDPLWRKTRLPQNQPQIVKDVIDKLSQAGCSDIQVLPETFLQRFASPMMAALPFVYLAMLFRMVQHFSNQHNSITSSESSSTDASKRNSYNATTFADVAGLDAILPDLVEIVEYLQNPAAFHALGAKPPRGILLYGPPGCGKTLLAKAVAGEAAVDAFVACNASDFVEVFVGRGAARVRHLFQQLRQRARERAVGGSWWQRLWLTAPFVPRKTRPITGLLFIDELDALAKTRSVLSSNDEREQTLMQLLTEMDGFATHAEDDVTIVVLAASNRADILDPAILRRFDRRIHVDYPHEVDRQAILQQHARSVRLQPERIDWESLANATPGMSGSDLRNIVNEAALLAVRAKSPVVCQRHLEEAARKHRVARAVSQRSTASQFLSQFVDE